MTDRNNEQRLEAEQPASVSISQTAKSDPLAFLNPTEFVQLPSKGKLYPKNHPLHGKDSVEIRFMTAKEEDILTSKSLLKKGMAIDRMLESVLVDKSIKLEDMLIGDKNALIIAARITGYGEDYETKVQCPSCGANVRHLFDLSKVKEHCTPPEAEKELVETGVVKIRLPITKLEVEIAPLKGSDEKAINKLAEERKADAGITDQLKLMVISVNSIKDKSIIEKFVENCPAGDAKFIRKKYGEITPNVDMTQKFSCKACDAEMEMEVPFTVDFFWSGR